MKSDNYVVIQGWMCNELNLKGNELLVFALIHGFCQDGTTHFTGSRSYIADTFNISLPTVDKALVGLKNKHLIEVYHYTNGNMSYKVSLQGYKETLHPYKVSLHNNIVNNIEDNNTITISKDIVENFQFGVKEDKPKKKSLFDKCVVAIDDFTEDAILRELLVASLKLFLDNSKEAGIKFYTNHFIGKLNQLKKLSEDNYVQRKIVQQTLDNGWNNFYELKTNNNKKNNTHERLNESGDLYVEHSNRRKEGRLNGEKF